MGGAPRRGSGQATDGLKWALPFSKKRRKRREGRDHTREGGEEREKRETGPPPGYPTSPAILRPAFTTPASPANPSPLSPSLSLRPDYRAWDVFFVDRSAKMVVIIATLLLGLLLATLFFTTRSHKKGNAKEGEHVSIRKVLKTYTKADVSLHKSRKDCWIIVKDKVYDVTPYVEEHPGGDAILRNAGGDSTEGFYGPQHATRVFDMVDDFYIGDLKP